MSFNFPFNMLSCYFYYDILVAPKKFHDQSSRESDNFVIICNRKKIDIWNFEESKIINLSYILYYIIYDQQQVYKSHSVNQKYRLTFISIKPRIEDISVFNQYKLPNLFLLMSSLRLQTSYNKYLNNFNNTMQIKTYHTFLRLKYGS